jgi:hypothetical protein
MSDEAKKKFRKATEAIDLNLGGLLGNLGAVLGEAVQKLTEAGEAAVDKIDEVQSGKGPIRTHAGVRVRVGGLASSGPKSVNPGRPRETAAPPPKTATVPRALDCEVIEDGTGWMITAEMPGVAPAEVALEVDGTRLLIRSTGARRYEGGITLPAPCPVEAISQSLVNGILTLTKGAA